MANKIVVITGASSGIGKETAIYLAQRGYRVIACVRKQRDRDKLLDACPDNLETVILDVNKEDDIIRLEKHVGEIFAADDSIRFFALINNAAVAPVAPIELLSMGELESVFRTNVFGAVRLIQVLLPYLKYTSGRIVNISSGSGLMAMPFSGAYSMSKFSLEALSDVLRVELRQFGIKIVVVEPGLIRTPLHQKSCWSMEELVAGFDAGQRDSYGKALRNSTENQGKLAGSATSAITVSKIITKALEASNPKTRYGVGNDAKTLRATHWLLSDGVRDKIVARISGL